VGGTEHNGHSSSTIQTCDFFRFLPTIGGLSVSSISTSTTATTFAGEACFCGFVFGVTLFGFEGPAEGLWTPLPLAWCADVAEAAQHGCEFQEIATEMRTRT